METHTIGKKNEGKKYIIVLCLSLRKTTKINLDNEMMNWSVLARADEPSDDHEEGDDTSCLPSCVLSELEEGVKDTRADSVSSMDRSQALSAATSTSNMMSTSQPSIQVGPNGTATYTYMATYTVPVQVTVQMMQQQQPQMPMGVPMYAQQQMQYMPNQYVQPQSQAMQWSAPKPTYPAPRGNGYGVPRSKCIPPHTVVTTEDSDDDGTEAFESGRRPRGYAPPPAAKRPVKK